jgi:hypothetical protein
LIPVARYAPDLPQPAALVTNYVNNVIPGSISYKPVQALVEQGDALDARCQGAGSFEGEDGVKYTFAGTGTKLYLWNGSTWQDVSRLAGGAYTLPAEGRWSFIQFATLFVIASNGIDATQVFTLGSSTNFTALANAPIARYLAVCRDILMLAHLDTNVQGIANSDYFDATEYTLGASDDQDLPNSGRVTGLVGGQYIVGFQQRRINLISPTGAIPAFQVDPVSEERGCVVPGSIANFQQAIFFAANDGFYRLDGGQQLTPIGNDEVDREFWGNVNQSYLERVTATVDPRNKLYLISFPSTNSVDGTPDRTLVYNWGSTGDIRWSSWDFGVELFFFMYAELSLTLEQYSALYPDLDDPANPSLDSEELTGNPIPKLACFTTDHKLAFFSGAPLAMTVDTVEAELSPGRRANINNVRPVVSGSSTISVALGLRNLVNDAVTFGSPVNQNAFGECPFRSNARYARARITVAANGSVEDVQGIDVTVADGGGR